MGDPVSLKRLLAAQADPWMRLEALGEWAAWADEELRHQRDSLRLLHAEKGPEEWSRRVLARVAERLSELVDD
jgi:hypothetical protein